MRLSLLNTLVIGFFLLLVLYNTFTGYFFPLHSYSMIRKPWMIHYNFSGFFAKQSTRSPKLNANKKKFKINYILQWTSSNTAPFNKMEVGQETFMKRHCDYTNCVITDDRFYLDNITQFDVILFHGPEIMHIPGYNLPQIRSQHQKYVFVSRESSHNYAVCNDRYNGYFNWSWTYKLNSDVFWGYVVVTDMMDNMVGPKENMHWMNTGMMEPVSRKFRDKLKSKTKAAAWFISSCYSASDRISFGYGLNKELKTYNLTIDIYGKCGTMVCESKEKCRKLLDESYYFYLAFENSFSEDYVTEKLVIALQNNVVPIVYGGANYTRFMPDGIYLNGRDMGVRALAAKMKYLIDHPQQYAEYFKWKSYYAYHNMAAFKEMDPLCRFCALINNEDKPKNTTIENFRDWWDGETTC